MSQATPTIGADQTGLNYRTQDNDGKNALLSQHKGSTAPAYAVAGTIWLDDNGTPWLLKIYDGADWIVIGAINATSNTLTLYQGAAALRYLNHAADTGTANAYVTAPSPAISSYVTGQIVTLKPGNRCTGASTLAVNGLSAVSIKLPDGGNPDEGNIEAGAVHMFMYDGTNFILLNPSPALSVQTVTSAASVTPTAKNDLVEITAQAEGLTIENPSGTLKNGKAMVIRIKDDGTTRAISFGTNYRAIGVTLPTDTAAGKVLVLGMFWNSAATKFDVTGVAAEA